MAASQTRNDPRAEARFSQALDLHRRGLIGQAQSLYEQALQLQPDHAEALHHLGIIAMQSRDPATAIRLIGQAVALNPANPAAHSNLGMAYEDAGQFGDALNACEKAIALKPDYAEAILNRGNILQALERWPQALASYDRLISLAPRFADAHNNRGNVLRKLGRRREAIESYSEAIRLKADFVQAFSNRGVVHKELREFDEALRSFDRALALSPDNPEVLNNRANALHEMDRLDEALADWERAIAQSPDFVEAHVNRGNALRELGRLDDAAASFRRALTIDPSHAGAQWTLSLLRLLHGDFEGGLPLYEVRWRQQGLLAVTNRRDFPFPRWDGNAPLAGRTILLHAEQGLGDTLQFCRYAPIVAAMGARVVLEVQRPLVRLLGNLRGVAHIAATGDTLPDIDMHCPLLSLPMALRTTLASIPDNIPYLQADPGLAGAWRQRLGPRSRPRIGLVWNSGTHPTQPELWRINKRRDVPFDLLCRLNLPGLDYYGLQKGDPAESETDTLRAAHWAGDNFVNCAAAIRDFADTAAALDCLDLVITVDTACAHLAGALGKRAWIMLPFSADWRWLIGRSDSPWYPSVTLYRQETAGNWTGVIERIGNDLARTDWPSLTAKPTI